MRGEPRLTGLHLDDNDDDYDDVHGDEGNDKRTDHEGLGWEGRTGGWMDGWMDEH